MYNGKQTLQRLKANEKRQTQITQVTQEVGWPGKNIDGFEDRLEINEPIQAIPEVAKHS
jgi:hypothetical protein